MTKANLGLLTQRDAARRRRTAAMNSAAGLLLVAALGASFVGWRELDRRDGEVGETIEHYERVADDVRTALSATDAVAADSTNAAPSATPADAAPPVNQQALEAPAGAPTIEPNQEAIARYEGAARSVQQSMQAFEANSPGAIRRLREQFETLHAAHIAALRANSLARAAVISSQINQLLRGEQLSYQNSPHGGPAFVSEAYGGADAPGPLASSDMQEMRAMLLDESLSEGAAIVLLQRCSQTAECSIALSDILIAPNTYYLLWAEAAQKICDGPATPVSAMRGVYTVLQDRSRYEDWRLWAFAMQVARCARNPDQEIVAAVAEVLSNPTVSEEFHGRASVNVPWIELQAIETLTSFGPAGRSAAPVLSAARTRYESVEDQSQRTEMLDAIDRALAAVSP